MSSTEVAQGIATILRETFGFETLRPGQLEVMLDVLDTNPVVSVMPTGAGKSLCYQIPALFLAKQGGISIVVSPLIALMKDQVDGLIARGVRCKSLTSAANHDEQGEILSSLRNGDIDILYVAPERFKSGRFMDTLASLPRKISLLAIDEAHCISEWGHDFRPAYRNLGSVVQKLAPERLLATTATATPEVRTDIAEQLGVAGPVFHIRGFARPTLTLEVEHCGGAADKSRRILTKLQELARDKSREGCALVYSATRKNAEKYSEIIDSAGFRVAAYHAGLDDKTRASVQEQYMNDELDVIVATNAFGMGVDKTDVRHVIHADLPRSIEAYYQEAGRAGRDSRASTCTLLFNHGDVRLQEFLIDASFPSADLLRGLWKFLRQNQGRNLSELAQADLPGSPHESTLNSALRILGRHGYLSEEYGAYEAKKPGEIRGSFPDFDPEEAGRRAKVEREKLAQMLSYSYHAGCRHRFMLDYFGEATEKSATCSGCDNCLGTGSAAALSEAQLNAASVLIAIVKSLDGRFGRTRLIGLALGTDDDQRFYDLPQRGELRGHTKQELMDLFRTLEAARVFSTSTGEYPTIQLTATGKKIARGQAHLDPALLRIVPSSKNGKSRKKKDTALPCPPDPEIAQRLRVLRTDLAKERSIPAYVVFSNRTLDELAARKPQSLSELDTIHGIGPSRVDHYGADIIAAITSS